MKKGLKILVLSIFALLILAFIYIAINIHMSNTQERYRKYGRYKISGDTANEGPQTDTPITDKAEELLKEKYGGDFVAYYESYYDEFSLIVNFYAHPVGEPNKRFWFNLNDDGELMISDSDYYPVLVHDDLVTYIYQYIKDFGIDMENLDARVVSYYKSTFSVEYLKGKDIIMDLYFDDRASADRLIDKREEFCNKLFEGLYNVDSVNISIYDDPSAKEEQKFVDSYAEFDITNDDPIKFHYYINGEEK